MTSVVTDGDRPASRRGCSVKTAWATVLDAAAPPTVGIDTNPGIDDRITHGVERVAVFRHDDL
jgi:hypothetical protein